MVLAGMRRLLREHAVQTLLMELWPTAMDRVAPCEDALTQLLQAGYQASPASMARVAAQRSSAAPHTAWRRVMEGWGSAACVHAARSLATAAD